MDQNPNPNTSPGNVPAPEVPRLPARPEVRRESQPASAPIEAAPAAPPQSAPAQPAPAAPVQPVTNPGQQLPTQNIVPGAGANPAIADDVDVIEKEWVDQADKIVEQTKDNPHQQEEAVESLQVDYLKKRYGHDVKKPDQKT